MVRVVHRNIRVSPSKAMLVCRLIHRKPLSEAYRILDSIQSRKTVKLLLKLLKEASHNAVNNYALNGDNLEIEECVATKGLTLKRSFARAKGRTDLILHRFSHLTVVLREGKAPSIPRNQQKKKSKTIKLGEELSTRKMEKEIKEV